MAGKKAHFKKNVKPPLKWEVKCSKSRKSLKRRHPVKKDSKSIIILEEDIPSPAVRLFYFRDKASKLLSLQIFTEENERIRKPIRIIGSYFKECDRGGKKIEEYSIVEWEGENNFVAINTQFLKKAYPYLYL